MPTITADDDRADGVPEKPQPTLVDLPMLIDESRKAGMQVLLECDVADLGAVRGEAADGLTVEIRNPWPVGQARTTPTPGAGMGIIGLAERTALSGGRLEHGRTPAGEFRLWTWLPWPT